MDRASDKLLVGRLLAGDERAFEEFFEAYFPRLYRFALARLDHNPDSAEEVVQATLSKVIVKLHTFRGEAALFSWLCTFCRHQISAFYRQRQRAPRPVALLEDEPEILAALESLSASDEYDPDEQLRRKELARLVQVTLDHLPPRYGDALEWKYIHGMTVKEIAALLEIGPKAAESLLTRARQAFRDGFGSIGRGLAEARLG